VIGILARASADRTYAVNFLKIHRFLKRIDHAWLLQPSEAAKE
jgi:hypothetical protein